MSRQENPYSLIIPALDLFDPSEALEKALELKELGIDTVKVGLALFLSSLLQKKINIVNELDRRGISVFLDLKISDIPKTMGDAGRVLSTETRADYLSVHASAGKKGLEFAHSNCGKTKLWAVTSLSSFDESDIKDIHNLSPSKIVRRLAGFAVASKCDGIIVSGRELPDLYPPKYQFLKKVAVGIRPTWSARNNDDQRRISTPKEAIERKANYLIIGRPILGADEYEMTMKEATHRIASEIASAKI